jgi:hypothetical protein
LLTNIRDAMIQDDHHPIAEGNVCRSLLIDDDDGNDEMMMMMMMMTITRNKQQKLVPWYDPTSSTDLHNSSKSPPFPAKSYHVQNSQQPSQLISCSRTVDAQTPANA